MATTREDAGKFEQGYIDKIAVIWEKENLPISKKIEKSQQVIDSVDKIQWPKGISVLMEEVAINNLKIILYKAEEKAMLAKYGNGKILDTNKILEEIAKGMRKNGGNFGNCYKTRSTHLFFILLVSVEIAIIPAVIVRSNNDKVMSSANPPKADNYPFLCEKVV